MVDIRAMCAIGLNGQLGLRGGLPWEGRVEPEFSADVARFFEATRGHVLLAGPVTEASIPDFAYRDRTIRRIRSADDPQEVISAYRGRVVFVGGGPAVWSSYAPYIAHWDITRLPYDGDADRWFDPAWLMAGNVDGAGRGFPGQPNS